MPNAPLPALVVTALITVALSTPAAAQAEVRDGHLYVDGEPFFAIGLYSVGMRDLPAVAEAGFNLVHTYSWEGQRTFDDGQEWLDACQESGLKALAGLYRPSVKEMDFGGTIERIRTYREHPALLAWHTMDEPGWDDVRDECLGVAIDGRPGSEYMPGAYEVCREHDPDHPVTAVFCHFADPPLFIDSVDIVQADYYCVPPIPQRNFSGTGFRGVKMFVDKTRQASDGEKPFWFVQQIFDWSVSKEESYEIPPEWQRGPNRAETRCATYTAVASGARGVLYWSLSRALGSEWHRDSLSRVRRWQDLVEVVGELNELMPVLTSAEREVIRTRDHVVAMVKSDGAAVWIIACNYERKPSDTVLTIPGVRRGTLEMPFRGESARIVDGALQVHFEPLEARVYRLRGDQNLELYPER
ncbi:MAG: hypothetical protein U9R79_01470 [Armatimonadota bacterium]|nr:hypothetical protein [Armatimonadota bacterium]